MYKSLQLQEGIHPAQTDFLPTPYRIYWMILMNLKHLSLFCSETQHLHRLVNTLWAWIVIFCSWSCMHETKMEKLRQGKQTNLCIIQIIWAFLFILLKETQSLEHYPLLRDSIFHCDCLFFSGNLLCPNIFLFSITEQEHLTVWRSYPSPRAGNCATWFYYTSLSISP